MHFLSLSLKSSVLTNQMVNLNEVK